MDGVATIIPALRHNSKGGVARGHGAVVDEWAGDVEIATRGASDGDEDCDPLPAETLGAKLSSRGSLKRELTTLETRTR